MVLRAVIEPAAAGGERREVEVVAGSFEQGRDEIDAVTPPGWRRRYIVVAG